MDVESDAAMDSSIEHLAGENSSVRRTYTLPWIRYINGVLVLLFAELITIWVLWFAVGDSKFFIDQITNYSFLGSVFDVAVVTTSKLITLIPSYAIMEHFTQKILSETYRTSSSTLKEIMHFLSIFLSFLHLTFAVTKGGLVLNAIINDNTYRKMHIHCNVMLICVVVFSLLLFLASLYSFTAMRNIPIIRIKHEFNEQGQELNDKGEPITKDASILRLVKLAKPEYPMLAIASVALMGSTASQVVAPLFFGLVVDAAQRSMEDLNRTVVILVLIYIGGALSGLFRSWLFTLAGQRFVARLRTQLFASIIKQDVAFFDTTRTGELTNRLSSDTQVLQNAVTVNMSMLVRYILQIIGSLVFMFILNAKLTGVLLSVVPVVSLGAVQYGKFLKKMRQQFQDRLADASTTAEEAISSLRTVRTFAGETKVVDHYDVDVDKSYQVGKKLALATGVFEGVIGCLSSGAICLVLWYGGKLVFEKELTAGILTAFLLYTLQVAIGFGLMSALYGDFMQAVGASVRIFQLLDRLPDIPTEGGSVYDCLQGDLQFNDVRFTYPSRPETEVLKGVSFNVSKGKMVALVGPSGGGKSTIVNLIERFYDPNSGTIQLGGMDLKSLDPVWFRKRISMVQQEPVLFACSIKDNIAYGKEATLEEVIEAAKQSNAHDFIMTFEEGYDTLVGERGVRLSGGQKQRVAIARSLIMDPAVLLLDEATSALDAESEHLVQEAIDRAMMNRTVVIIAHRLSTVRSASQVIVIDQGKIAEQGTHSDLLQKGGIYKKLVLRQLIAGEATAKMFENELGNGNDDSKTNSDELILDVKSALSDGNDHPVMNLSNGDVDYMANSNTKL